jgi:hypothetical protein
VLYPRTLGRLLAGVGQVNHKVAEEISLRSIRRHTFDEVRIAQIVVDDVESLQPFVTIGMKVDCWYVSLTHLNKKLAEDYPLHGFVNVVEHS